MVSGKPNDIRFFRLSLRRGGPGVVSLRTRQFAFDVRRGAGVVERGGLENRCALTRTEGSNPSLSAILQLPCERRSPQLLSLSRRPAPRSACCTRP